MKLKLRIALCTSINYDFFVMVFPKKNVYYRYFGIFIFSIHILNFADTHSRKDTLVFENLLPPLFPLTIR